MALYKNLIVSVLRYEQIKTTEAQRQGGARQGRADHHARQAGHPRPRRRDHLRSCPNEPLVIDKLINEIAPQVWRPDLGLHPHRHEIGLRAGDAAAIVQLELV